MIKFADIFKICIEHFLLQYLTTQEKLKDEWFIFQESLKEAEGMLKKHKVYFCSEHIHCLLENLYYT